MLHKIRGLFFRLLLLRTFLKMKAKREKEMLKRYKDTIVFEYKGEKVKLYAVKEGVIRVQAAWKEEITKDNKNLLFSRPVTSKISKEEKGYSLRTGSLTAFISEMGEISFYRDSTLLLKEKYRSFDYESPHSHPLKETARSYAAKAYPYAVKVSFEENENNLEEINEWGDWY